MKKRIVSGWVLSFSSEESLLEAVKKLLKEEGLRWEVCAPYPCAAVRLANRHAGRAVGAGVRLWAVAGGLCGAVAWPWLIGRGLASCGGRGAWLSRC